MANASQGVARYDCGMSNRTTYLIGAIISLGLEPLNWLIGKGLENWGGTFARRFGEALDMLPTGVLAAFGIGMLVPIFLPRFLTWMRGDGVSGSPPTEFATWLRDSADDRDKLLRECRRLHTKQILEDDPEGFWDRVGDPSFDQILDDAIMPVVGETKAIGAAVGEFERVLSGASATIFEFARTIYPGDFAYTSYPEIHALRRALAKQWDEWGRRIVNREGMAFHQIEDFALSQMRELKLLTYLELAQCKQRNTMGRGKYGLFHIAQKAAQSSRSV